MEKPNIAELNKQIKIAKIKRRSIIPFMKGRPKRDTIIQNDDILNLVILLNSCKTLKEFLEKV